MYHKNIAFHIFLFFLIFKSQVSATSFNEVADFQNTLVNILKKTILIDEDQNKEIDISFEIFSQPKIIRWCSNQEKILSLINDSNLSEFKTILQAPVLKICKGLNFLAAKKIPEDIKNKIDQNEDLSEQEEHNLRKIKFNSLEEKLVLSSFKKIKSKILEVRINKIPEVASLQSGEEGIDLSQASKPIQAYFRLILNEYFDSWDSENKVKLILDMLSLPKGASSESRLLLILNHCGPILQKTFQLFSRDSKSELLVKVLQNLKENIKPFDTELAKDIVSKYLEGPLSLHFENFPNYPIASATIGQVYIIPLVDSDDRVVVKIRRPGIKAKAKKELTLLRSLTHDEGVLSIIDALEKSFNLECDFKNEADNLKKSNVYRKNYRSGRITSIRLREDFPLSEEVLFMTEASGSSLVKTNITNTLILKALKDLFYFWLEEAFFASGFFHADLHAGNIFIDSNYRRRCCVKRRNYCLSILDFGSVGSFTKNEIKSLIKIILGLSYNSEELVTLGLSTVVLFDSKKLTDLKYYLNNDLKEQGSSLEIKIQLLFDYLINNNFKIPENFILFNRGRKFLEDQIIYHSTLLKIESGIGQVYTDLFQKNLLFDILLTGGGGQDDSTALIDNSVLSELLYYYIWGTST